MPASLSMDTLETQLKKLGLQSRKSQRHMLEKAFAAFQARRIACIEAPTGTGKTLSYGLAALSAKAEKQTVVISTATIALQEQLIQKDLPLLSQILKRDIHFSIAKGRRRYVCHAKLFQEDGQSDWLEKNNDRLDELRALLEKKRWYGDREKLPFAVDNALWQQVSTDATGCNGRHCSFYEDCAFYKARKKMHQSEVIVTNHSLLLSDLELGGGAILPEMENCLYVIDECHHLPDKALSHFGKSATTMGSVDWLNQLTKTLSRGTQQDAFDAKVPERFKPLIHDIVQQLKLIDDYLIEEQQQFEEGRWLLLTPHPTLDIMAINLTALTQKLRLECETLINTLEQQIKRYEKTQKDHAETLSRFATQCQFILSRATNLDTTWRLFSHERAKGEAPIARWFTQDQHHTCHASPINISNELRKLFWEKLSLGAVLCSATVRALGNFHHYYRRTGLKALDGVEEIAIDPFFDYSRSVLFVPTMQHAPQGANIAHHQTEVNRLLPELILPKTGTLVLFTSLRAMEATYDALDDTLAADVFMQSQHSKSKIIALHKDRIRCGERSILFGLASFGEGLDLPADFCEHVIIHKLPFSVPTTPIELTRNAWLKHNNKNAFMLSTLPDTSIRLTQYAGRLLRQESDIGIITILDNRLYTKAYGKQLLSNFTAYRQCINQSVTQLKAIDSIKHLYQSPLPL